MRLFCIRPIKLLFVGIVVSTILFIAIKTSGSSSSLHFDRHRDVLENVFNQTLGFQKIFVISLPYRTDQKDAMTLAASLTGLELEFVDGVSEVNGKALPDGAVDARLSSGAINNWRAHLNVISKIVAQNITSALVLEGDVDWDIRIKSQMRDFALATRLLIQPLVGTTDGFLDPTFPRPSSGQEPQNFPVDAATLRQVTKPNSSPYGDLTRWDVLWLGHCGAFFPTPNNAASPLGRAVVSDDETVPEMQHVNTQFGGHELLEQYQDHTRVVSWAHDMTCTLGYGISQAGAKRMLYELGIRRLTGATDMMFRSVCQGTEGRDQASCLTVQPQLFQHHRPAGSKGKLSDIEDLGASRNERGFTRNIRWSTQLNLAKLIKGEKDYVDLFKDDTPSPAWLEP